MAGVKKVTAEYVDDLLKLKFRVDTLKQFIEQKVRNPNNPILPVKMDMAAGVIPLILGEEEADKLHGKVFDFLKANDDIYFSKLEKAYEKLSKNLLKRVPDYDVTLNLPDTEELGHLVVEA